MHSINNVSTFPRVNKLRRDETVVFHRSSSHRRRGAHQIRICGRASSVFEDLVSPNQRYFRIVILVPLVGVIG